MVLFSGGQKSNFCIQVHIYEKLMMEVTVGLVMVTDIVAMKYGVRQKVANKIVNCKTRRALNSAHRSNSPCNYYHTDDG